MYSLQPGQLLTVDVTFAPAQGGHYDAELPITTGANTTLVELTGDASGSLAQDATDFYACGCRGGTPVQGWPLIAAVLVVVRRRREAA